MPDLMMTALLQTGPPNTPSKQHFNDPIIILNTLIFELLTAKTNALLIQNCIIILVP